MRAGSSSAVRLPGGERAGAAGFTLADVGPATGWCSSGHPRLPQCRVDSAIRTPAAVAPASRTPSTAAALRSAAPDSAADRPAAADWGRTLRPSARLLPCSGQHARSAIPLAQTAGTSLHTVAVTRYYPVSGFEGALMRPQGRPAGGATQGPARETTPPAGCRHPLTTTGTRPTLQLSRRPLPGWEARELRATNAGSRAG